MRHFSLLYGLILLIPGVLGGDGPNSGRGSVAELAFEEPDLANPVDFINPNKLSKRASIASGAHYYQVSAGDRFSAALLADGTVRTWGDAPVPPEDLEGVTKISAGARHVVVRLNDGRVRAFGDNSEGQCDVPTRLPPIKDVAAGAAHSLLVTSSGTLYGFGRNVEGQLNIPYNLTNVRTVAAGSSHSLALLTSGAIRAWGDNTFGQSTVPEIVAGYNESSFTEARSIAAGSTFSAAALGDGSVIVWGLWNGKQQTVRYYIGLSLGRNLNLVQIVAGELHIAIRSTGPDGIFVLGDNTYGQTNTPRSLQFPQSEGIIQNLAAGSRHNIALLADGSLLTWGCKSHDFGQCKRPDPCRENNGGCHPFATCSNDLGVAKCVCRTKYVGDGHICRLAASPTITQVATKGNYSLVLMSDGTVKGWGKWYNGNPVSVPPYRNVAKIAAGARHALVLFRNGVVKGFGANSPNLLIPKDLGTVKELSLGSGYSIALRTDGTVRAWGLSRVEASGLNGLSRVLQVSAGHDHALALLADGSVRTFGFGAVVGDPSGKLTPPPGMIRAVAVSAGYDHSLVLQADGTVVGFGGDAFGQKRVPAGLMGVVGVVAGEKRSAAILQGGAVVAWGADDRGQSKAVRESGVKVRSLALGEAHALAVNPDGSLRLFCGSDEQGQCAFPDPCVRGRVCSANALCSAEGGVASCVCRVGYSGDGRSCVRDVGARVVQVVAGYESTAVRYADGRVRAWGTYFTDVPLDLENVAHLSAGPGYYVAVTAEGRLRAWGGREGTAQMLLPVGLAGVKATSATTALLQDGSVSVWGSAADDLMPPQDLNDVVQISSSGVHTLALRKDGSVRGWGNPVLAGVQGLDGIVQISASTTHNLALTRDGSVLAFGGYDFYGEREVPEGLPRVKYVAAGTGYSLAVLIDGTVEAWGWNTTGQIGVPAGLKSVKQVAAGDRHAAALLEDGTVVSWGKTTDVPADIAAHDVALERHM